MRAVDVSTIAEVTNLLNSNLPPSGYVGVMAGLIGPNLNGDACVSVGSVSYPDGSGAAPPNEGTLYRLASCTKTFTATLYGYALIIKKAMTASDTIQRYLPLQALRPLSVGALATYTSGLPADNTSNPGTSPPDQQYPYTTDAMCTYLTEQSAYLNQLIDRQLQQPNPYAYSNLGFGLLLACVLAALDASDPLSLFAETLFTPLGMNASGLMPGDQPQLPIAYDRKGNPVSVGSNLLPAYLGAGGVYTSAADLFRWLHFNMGTLRVEPLSSLLSFLRQQTVQHPPISEAWFLKVQTDTSYWKNGGAAGASSWMGYTADLQYGAFVLANCSGLASQIGPSVLSILTGGSLPADALPNELEP